MNCQKFLVVALALFVFTSCSKNSQFNELLDSVGEAGSSGSTTNAGSSTNLITSGSGSTSSSSGVDVNIGTATFVTNGVTEAMSPNASKLIQYGCVTRALSKIPNNTIGSAGLELSFDILTSTQNYAGAESQFLLDFAIVNSTVDSEMVSGAAVAATALTTLTNATTPLIMSEDGTIGLVPNGGDQLDGAMPVSGTSCTATLGAATMISEGNYTVGLRAVTVSCTNLTLLLGNPTTNAASQTSGTFSASFNCLDYDLGDKPLPSN
jgi:hypothetical protein